MDAQAELCAKIDAGTAVVGIYGLVYVGLPLALSIFARRRYRAIGFDFDAQKIESLHNGRSYFRHLPSPRALSSSPAREHAALAGRASIAPGTADLAAYDALRIATDHDGIDYSELVARAKLVLDTPNVCERVRADNVVKA